MLFINSSSAMFGIVTLSFGSACIARRIANIAPSFLAQERLLIPLFTSQNNIFLSLLSASSLPSITIPKPPLITSPQPTPPPLCIDTHVAPLKLSPMQFCTAMSAVKELPS